MVGATGVITLLHELASCSWHQKTIFSAGFCILPLLQLPLLPQSRLERSCTSLKVFSRCCALQGGSPRGLGVAFLRHDSGSERHKNWMSGIKINTTVLLLAWMALKLLYSDGVTKVKFCYAASLLKKMCKMKLVGEKPKFPWKYMGWKYAGVRW